MDNKLRRIIKYKPKNAWDENNQKKCNLIKTYP